MNSLRKVKSILDKGKTDVVPVCPYFLGDYACDLSGIKPYEYLYAGAKVRANAIVETCYYHDFDWVLSPRNVTREFLNAHEIVETGSDVFLRNRKTGEMLRFKENYLLEKSSEAKDKNLEFNTKKQIDGYIKLLNADDLIDTGVVDCSFDIVRQCGKEKFVMGQLSGVMAPLINALGYEKTLTMMIDSPDMVKYFLERVHLNLRETVKAHKKAAVHGVFIEEGHITAELISPEFYKEFVLPFHQAIMEEARKQGLYILLYQCGPIIPLLDLISSDMDIDILMIEENRKNYNTDIRRIRQKLNRDIVLMGNMAADTLLRGDCSEIENEVMEIEKAMEGHPFIMGTGSPFVRGTKAEAIEFFVKAAARKVLL